MTKKISRAQSKTATAADQAKDGFLDIDEAINFLKTTRPTFYRWLKVGRIKGVKAGRQWRFQREDLERFLNGEAPRVELTANPSPLLLELRAALKKLGRSLPPRETSDPLAEAVSLMLRIAVAQEASDFHLEPHQDGKGWRGVLRHRVTGTLRPVASFDLKLLAPLIAHWKKIGNMNTEITHLPQDGRYRVSLDQNDLDVRLTIAPAMMGETLTGRILDRNLSLLSIGQLGFHPEDEGRLREAIRRPPGLILVAGPAGSGKTITLYSCLMELAGPATKTMTIEDPVEYIIPWTTQFQTRPHTGLTALSLLRTSMRLAPNVVCVGNVSDAETFSACLQVAATGHLVLADLHAPDAASALARMVETGMPPHLVAETTTLAVAQRLARKLCPKCSKPARLKKDEIASLAKIAAQEGVSDLPDSDFRNPSGCAACVYGYTGRIALAETMRMAPELARTLRDGASRESLCATAIRQGMSTIAGDALRKASQGLISYEDAKVYLAPGFVA